MYAACIYVCTMYVCTVIRCSILYALDMWTSNGKYWARKSNFYKQMFKENNEDLLTEMYNKQMWINKYKEHIEI